MLAYQPEVYCPIQLTQIHRDCKDITESRNLINLRGVVPSCWHKLMQIVIIMLHYFEMTANATYLGNN